MMTDGFLSRWSKRKAGKEDEIKDDGQESAESIAPAIPEVQTPPPVTLEDVEKIDRFDPDFSAFMRADVDPAVQQAALKKMFSDPHFNVMDGLDIYIDDYSNPELLPSDMLRGLVQSDLLGLFKTADNEMQDSNKAEDQAAQVEKLANGVSDHQPKTDLTSRPSLQKQGTDNATDHLAQKKNITEDKS
jgi:hypothetical protein